MNKLVYIFLISILFISCGDADIVFQETKKIDDAVWNKMDRVSFEFDINDTTEYYDFYFNLRTTTSYEWANLYVFVEIKFPSGQYNIDTVEFPIATPSGEWSGIRSGSIVTNDILFINKRRFPQKGKYTLSFDQAMRQDELAEVLDIGIIMKKAEVKKK